MDMSFNIWYVRLTCDDPSHVYTDRYEGDAVTGPEIFGGDRPELSSKREYISEYRRLGWQFCRDGRTICPECSAKKAEVGGKK